MGFLFSKIWRKVIGNQDVRMIMVGLDAAGKTSILYQLKIAELVRSIPTIGFNVENVQYKGLNMTIWDIGGQQTIRALWKHYYENNNAIVFVVDSSDHERIDESAEELNFLLKADELKDCKLLVLANKQDMKDVMSPNEISEKLGLINLKSRKWLVQGTSAVTGQGISEGFDWLANELLKNK